MVYKKIFLISGLLISILLVSGCIGQQQQVYSVNGIEISNIYTDPQQDLIEAGDVFTIYYELNNVGGTPAKNVVTAIYGLPWIIESQQATFCHPPGCEQGLTLYPEDPVTKSAGGLEPVSFKIPVPIDILPSGLKKSFDIRIRVVYDYNTKATSIIQGYSKKRYNRDIQLGNQVSVSQVSIIPIQTTISGAPITISVSGPDRIIVNDGTKNIETLATYQITFNNVGQGQTITDDIPGLINVDKISIQGAGALFHNCLDEDYFGKEISGTQIKLVGDSVTKSCTIEIMNSPGDENSWNDREFDTIHISFELSYRYYTEKTFPITVTAPVSYERGFR